MRSFLILFCILITITSCEVYTQDEYEEFYVVESYLVANRQLPQVRLTTTGLANEVYTVQDFAVNDAQVEIHLLQTSGDIEDSFEYTLTQDGIYLPLVEHDVVPERTYELNISIPNSNEVITARTVIPGSFKIMGRVEDSIVYQSTEQLEFKVRTSYPGRQNIFVFNTLALSPEEENLTPLYRELYESGDKDPDDLILYANNSSGIINEGNFENNPDGSITIKFPWLGIAFYGDNLMVVNTIDDNLYDFVRTQTVQLGGSTLSPGEIQNVISHVKGGIGVFGAIASDTVQTYVKRFDEN